MAEKISREPDGSSPTVRTLLDRAREAGLARDPRPDIVSSWQRSVLAGLTPDVFDVPFVADVDDRGRLARVADPVLSRVADDLDGTSIGLVLTDDTGLIVSRGAGGGHTLGLLDKIQLAPGFRYGEEQIGTNAIGTALQRRAPTFVQAGEHFADALTTMACAAMTINDPATGRVLGVVDLTCAAGDANPLMLPFAKRTAWEIEQRLLDDSSAGERLLQEHFLRARRATRAPLVAISHNSLLVNASATNVIQPTDRERLWDCVLQVLRTSAETCSFPSSNGDLLTLRCQSVADGSRLVGALLHVESNNRKAPAASRGRRSSARDFGWHSLTDAELAVAVQVSQGMTNREAAAHLYLSPHTIDYYLRQLFRKLDVESRVELTRVVLEHR